ncbi:GntR family transcriptional regulator [Luteolibacter arcticus]|uniref:GntR family transcriptional regulator n=1 Tax=Luteolibacter arcticus TaxID=1581411 RepID=A0ABT3GSJ8_9BACT|nr:GntR family transcriptional regulator [Luteolibacter arcticus]MCW1926503.1 GntR family transcriptional regulator [Luteolibacter arcticus]
MNTRAPAKHEDISAELRKEIAAGKYGEEGRLPSDSKLMERFGVSRPTVAQAMRTLTVEGLVIRKTGSGTYARPPSQSSMPISTHRLALLMPHFGHTEIFQLIAGHLASLARHHEYSLVWGGSTLPQLDADTRLEHGEELCQQFIENRVDGVFFSPYEFVKGGYEANLRMVKRFRDAGIPVVLVDHDIVAYPERSEFDLVGVDNAGGGFLMGRHLMKLGCTRFVHVARPLSASTIDARYTGLWKAVSQFGDSECFLKAERGEASDAVFANKIMSSRPDAIVCGNDHTAALLVRTLAKIGVSVPGDVRVTGFDDASFASLVSPPLTTIRQPCQEIAISAFRAMLDRIQDPSLPARGIRLNGSLVVRESCGAYGK